MNENKNTTYQNMWDADKAMLIGKCIALNASFRKEDRPQSNNLCSYLKKIEKVEQSKHKLSIKHKRIIKKGA